MKFEWRLFTQSLALYNRLLAKISSLEAAPQLENGGLHTETDERTDTYFHFASLQGLHDHSAKARGVGVDEAGLEDALDGDAPTLSIVELIIAHHRRQYILAGIIAGDVYLERL